jgi:hypothetical protein
MLSTIVLSYYQEYLLVIEILLVCRWCLASLLYFLLCCSAGHLWPHVPSCLVRTLSLAITSHLVNMNAGWLYCHVCDLHDLCAGRLRSSES